MRPGREQNGTVGSGLVQQGEMLVHGVVDVAVGINDHQKLPVRLGARNAAAGNSVER